MQHAVLLHPKHRKEQHDDGHGYHEHIAAVTAGRLVPAEEEP